MTQQESTALVEGIQRLIEEWRQEAAIKDSFHATMGIGWKVCADELEARLADLLPSEGDRE